MKPATDPTLAARLRIRPSAPSAARRPPEPGVHDRILLEAAQRGDRLAFAALVTAHERAVFGYLRARLLEPSDAEDLCQEVFLRTYVGRVRFDGQTALRPWLLGVARNLLREHVRRVRRRKEVAWTELCLQLEELVDASHEQYEDALRHLPDCLTALGQSARQALDLHYQARLRLTEIGQRLHRSEGAVKLLMFRARQALRHCLNGKLLGAAHD
jgi:RNA polymerase sigma-70 factor (ECF subfamily)